MSEAQSEYEAERRGKLIKLRELGINPFGVSTADVESAKAAREACTSNPGEVTGPKVTVAGRIVLKRDMGKLSFLTIRDDTGDIQVALDRRRLNDTAWGLRDLLDLGDLINASGPLGKTKTGEATVWAEHVAMDAKSLLPPPGKFEGLSDIEQRYRQRYVDLWSNPQVMKMAQMRIRIVDEIRAFLKARGYLEVETPMLQLLHGGATARPFQTHHNALDLPLYMRIAPELFLKRLLVGGMKKIFEINRNFRNEGISPRHNPEFTMLEAYEAHGNWETMAAWVEELICHLAANVINHDKPEDQKLIIQHEGGKTINLARPWKRATMAELVEQATGWKFEKQPISEALLSEIRQKNHGKDIKHHADPAQQLVELYEKLVEPNLIDPCFVTRVPSVVIPLARSCADDPFFADVYELAINGQEISPGYTELNDPDVQEKHFLHQVGDELEKQKVDQDFLNALKYGMPPAGGMGMGIDRLVMMLTGAQSIRDVILFPLMKPVE